MLRFAIDCCVKKNEWMAGGRTTLFKGKRNVGKNDDPN